MAKAAPPKGSKDWLWYRPESDPDKWGYLESAEGWYTQAYHHKPCEVGWLEKVSDAWTGRPRCFNCGRFVKRRDII